MLSILNEGQRRPNFSLPQKKQDFSAYHTSILKLHCDSAVCEKTVFVKNMKLYLKQVLDHLDLAYMAAVTERGNQN